MTNKLINKFLNNKMRLLFTTFFTIIQLSTLLFSQNSEQFDYIYPQNENIKLMSFNIRYSQARDGAYKWKNRKAAIINMLNEKEIDILGVQEAQSNQVNFFNKNLISFDYVGVGRANGKKRGEFTAIFYNTNRFEAIDKGNFWLSETPDKISKGWDASVERIASWVILKDKLNNDTLFVINTHFDHLGKVARKESAKLIIKYISSLIGTSSPMAIVLMGDLNCAPDSEPILTILNNAENKLFDSKERAYVSEGIEGTFHNYGKIMADDRVRIDYIFVNNKVEVLKYENIGTEMKDEMWLSDHSAIMSTIKIVE